MMGAKTATFGGMAKAGMTPIRDLLVGQLL
jgi:hypothetical protein